MKLNLIYTVILAADLFVSSAPLNEKRALSCLSSAKFTQYWIPKEGEQDMSNSGGSMALSGSKTKSLMTSDGSTIAQVSETTYEKLEMEVTGLLSSGVMVNLGSSKEVFVEVDRSSSPYGLGFESHISLEPWVSVASNNLDLGTLLYIKELDGVSLPNGKIHNGCVRVDDVGWGLESCQVDFFVLQFSAFQELSSSFPSTVTATEKSCSVQNYVTSAVQNWAVL
ncbi:hypothetical protein K501DRAFT_292614 [Backusella circina FSU 941]|nr:hypothetical protein K501DRAFT_292614 [Backusella circina FSU 941]